MILGLHGKMGSGKDTACELLKELSPVPVVRVSYAAKLKESAAALLGVHLDDLELYKNDPSKMVALGGIYDGLGFVPYREKTMAVREFLQRYGTESHRNVFGEDFWLDAALPLEKDYSDALYVVTDVRFQNEADRIRSLGGKIVKVIGPVEDTGSHASERPLVCDFTIDNTVRDDDFSLLRSELGGVLYWLGLIAPVPA